MVSVQIIIPVFNHWATTATCIGSILKNETEYSYEIIVVDNASTDMTQKFIQKLIDDGHPVKLVTKPRNTGFVGAVNSAFTMIDSKYILLLNNDVLLDKYCIQRLVDTMKKYSKLGILGGAQFDSVRQPLSQLKFFVKGKEATIDNHITMRNLTEDESTKDYVICDDIHMACAMLSHEAFEQVGNLDNAFSPGNYDQEDYCLRVKEAGYEVAVCPSAKFIHYPSTSVSDNFLYWQSILNRNRKIWWSKWGDKLRCQEPI